MGTFDVFSAIYLIFKGLIFCSFPGLHPVVPTRPFGLPLYGYGRSHLKLLPSKEMLLSDEPTTRTAFTLPPRKPGQLIRAQNSQSLDKISCLVKATNALHDNGTVLIREGSCMAKGLRIAARLRSGKHTLHCTYYKSFLKREAACM